ncbi:MAG TPA: hypothetical protein VMM92_09165, partial [Thermoanaerobaculia bacterium]|nr:hypothetical protein [Thermoanaerobaculia bacterium]
SAAPADLRREPGRIILEIGTVPLPEALAKLWLLGVEPDWRALHTGSRRQRVPLPTYPFERRRHWVDAPGVPRPLGFLD